MKAVAFIFARGGSKGLPGKNIRPLCGKPLIAWSIEQAISAVGRVIVSTDSPEIASVSRTYGAEVPFIRPDELARDDSPEWLSWQHALRYLQTTEGSFPDAFVSVPATAPLRVPEDITRCIEAFAKGIADVIITVSEAHRNPYFNMVQSEPDGSVRLVIPPKNAIGRRQDSPEVFDVATVAYVAKPSFVMNHRSIFEGRVRQVLVPVERAVDIDTIFDFRIAECLMESRRQPPLVWGER